MAASKLIKSYPLPNNGCGLGAVFYTKRQNDKYGPADLPSIKRLFKAINCEFNEYPNPNFQVGSPQNLHTSITLLKEKFKAKRKNFSYLFFIFIGHGSRVDGREYLYLKDKKKCNVDWLYDQFSLLNFPECEGHVKIFLLQACRGDRSEIKLNQSGYSKPAAPGSELVSQYKDMYVLLPSFMGHKSFYLTKSGISHFFKIVCETFIKHHQDLDIHEMALIVKEKLSGKVISVKRSPSFPAEKCTQTVTEISTLSKKFYFTGDRGSSHTQVRTTITIEELVEEMGELVISNNALVEELESFESGYQMSTDQLLSLPAQQSSGKRRRKDLETQQDQSFKLWYESHEATLKKLKENIQLHNQYADTALKKLSDLKENEHELLAEMSNKFSNGSFLETALDLIYQRQSEQQNSLPARKRPKRDLRSPKTKQYKKSPDCPKKPLQKLLEHIQQRKQHIESVLEKIKDLKEQEEISEDKNVPVNMGLSTIHPKVYLELSYQSKKLGRITILLDGPYPSRVKLFVDLCCNRSPGPTYRGTSFDWVFDDTPNRAVVCQHYKNSSGSSVKHVPSGTPPLEKQIKPAPKHTQGQVVGSCAQDRCGFRIVTRDWSERTVQGPVIGQVVDGMKLLQEAISNYTGAKHHDYGYHKFPVTISDCGVID